MITNMTTLAIIALFANSLVLAAARLSTDIYNPKKNAIFPTASTLLFGLKNAIQFDAQFSTKDGAEVDKIIEKSGKNLELIIISCGDPDYYFGLQPIKKSYPHVRIVASEDVVNHIRATKDEKLEYWAPKLKSGTPTELFVPDVINSTIITLNGELIELRAQKNYAAYYWIPGQKQILGGVGVSWGIHVFTADTKSTESRRAWRKVLEQMIGLKPEDVIPGHYLGERPSGSKAIQFTLQYLRTFEKVLRKNNYKNSTAVIAEMKKNYPNLGLESSLELGAKVITGEMQYSR